MEIEWFDSRLRMLQFFTLGDFAELRKLKFTIGKNLKIKPLQVLYYAFPLTVRIFPWAHNGFDTDFWDSYGSVSYGFLWITHGDTPRDRDGTQRQRGPGALTGTRINGLGPHTSGPYATSGPHAAAGPHKSAALGPVGIGNHRREPQKSNGAARTTHADESGMLTQAWREIR